MSKGRVVYLLCPGRLERAGGIGRALSYLVAEWAQAEPNLRVELADTRGSGSILLAPLFLARALARLVALALAGRLALVHINLASYGSTVRKSVVIAACAVLRAPVLLHLHGAKFHVFYRGLPAPLRAGVRWMFGRARCVVVLGESWRRFVVEELQVPPSRVRIVANGVRAGSAAPADGRAAAQVLFLGRLEPRKGVPELVAALALPRLAALSWRATLAGDGDVAGFQADAARRGFAGRVDFPGWVNEAEVDRLLANADILVLPSHHEGLPVAVLEALAHRVAVITTPVGSIPDFLVDRVSCLLVPPGDVAALSLALEALITSSDLRRAIAEGGYEVFRREFDVARVAEAFAGIYRQIDPGLAAPVGALAHPAA